MCKLLSSCLWPSIDFSGTQSINFFFSGFFQEVGQTIRISHDNLKHQIKMKLATTQAFVLLLTLLGIATLKTNGFNSTSSFYSSPATTTSYRDLQSKHARYYQDQAIKKSILTDGDLEEFGKGGEKRGLNPIILIPGDGGSRIQAKLDRQKAAHVYCERKTNDWFDLWLNLSLLVPFALDCWVEK